MSNGIEPISTTETLLAARDVHKTYAIGKRKLEVLRGVDLEIARGEFLALRGASGAGKSTLLHLLGGLDLPDAGEVAFLGKNIKKMSNSDLARWRSEKVGLIFQAYHLLPELTAIENVCLPARMLRRSTGEIQGRAFELLKRVGLGERFDHRPYELSGGE
ncbi:MAG: ABC transporter ATP-binding protein [Limisphaerales bacterium]